jgi:N-sulfoglucosamine sulfohydrolase
MSLSRRRFFERVAAASALSGARAGAQSGPQSGRANVLYIIQEDTGPNHACYGEPLVKTPNVDRLAAQGTLFTNMFCTGPVCSASRSALMSGRYQNNIGAHNHRTWEWNKKPLPAPARHISEWFRDAGYFTCNLQPERGKRKMLNGAGGSGKVDLNFFLNGADKNNFFDGIDWKERKNGQRFFAHITIVETHKGGGWKLARQKPKSELVDPEKLKLGAYYPDTPVARDEYANYLDALHLSDGYVGQLLQRLEDEGLARNTVVVLSSDHGPLFRGKQFLYDGGMRLPLIVRFPDGRSAGAVDNRLVSAIDLAPTMLGFAGIRPPAGAMQGRDIFGPSYEPRTHVFAARDRMDMSIDRMRAVRTDRYKYIRNYFPMIPYMQYNEYKEQNYPTWNLVKDWAKQGKLNKEQSLFAAAEKPMEELFDLKADPDEVRNLAGDPKHRDTLKRLRGLVDSFVAENDKRVNFEDPVDVYRGYYKHLPEDPAE